jgi:hypothetical protein
VVSLIVNDRKVLNEDTLSDVSKTIEIVLSDTEENNYLIAFAHSIGDNPPAPMGIAFTDGKTPQQVSMTADFEECDIVNFHYSPQPNDDPLFIDPEGIWTSDSLTMYVRKTATGLEIFRTDRPDDGWKSFERDERNRYIHEESTINLTDMAQLVEKYSDGTYSIWTK